MGCMRYEGPGFRAYMFGGVTDKYQAIIIEALADIGTAWYWIVLSDGKRIVSQRLMDEPRANSDICDLKDVMQISVSDVDCKIRMELKHIARYSTIPKYLKTDSRWVYITMPIGKNLEGVETLALGMKYEKRSPSRRYARHQHYCVDGYTVPLPRGRIWRGGGGASGGGGMLFAD